MVELWKGNRVNGIITKLIGNCIAEVRVADQDLVRHYNQIWKCLSTAALLLDFEINENETLVTDRLYSAKYTFSGTS